MYEVLREILVHDLQCDERDVRPAATREDVGLDSLTAVELSALLNSRLGIQIADYELLDSVTIADVADLMLRRHPA